MINPGFTEPQHRTIRTKGGSPVDFHIMAPVYYCNYDPWTLWLWMQYCQGNAKQAPISSQVTTQPPQTDDSSEKTKDKKDKKPAKPLDKRAIAELKEILRYGTKELRVKAVPTLIRWINEDEKRKNDPELAQCIEIALRPTQPWSVKEAVMNATLPFDPKDSSPCALALRKGESEAGANIDITSAPEDSKNYYQKPPLRGNKLDLYSN
jgi:hypothetical protein